MVAGLMLRVAAHGVGGGGDGGGGDGLVGAFSSLKLSANAARWCADHGIGFKLVGQLRSIVANLHRVLARHLKVPPSSLLLDAAPFPAPGAEGARRLALLRLLLLWSFPERILAEAPRARSARAARADAERLNGGSGSDSLVEIMPALPVEGTPQSPALEQLVPPAKYPWKLATKGCEVVQVALADAPERCSTADGVAEALLLPQLQPQWCVIFDDLAPQQVQTSADLRCVLYAAEAVASALKLDEATDTGGGGATALKGPLKGLVCRGSPEVVRVAQGGGGGYGAAPLAYVKCDCGVLSKQQRTKLDQLLRHRAAAAEAMVILTRQRTGGAHGVAGHLVGHGGSLVASNCAPLAAAGASAAAGLPGGAPPMLSPPVLTVLSAAFGARATFYLSHPNKGQKKQLLRFADTDAAAAAAAAAAPQPPLVADRPAGVRLLCALASGHRDNRLRAAPPPPPPSAPGGGTPFGAEDYSKGSALSCGKGLAWTLRGEAMALLPRYSLPCHVLPPAHDVPLYAVGATEMYIGSKGDLVAVEGVTLLPGSSEWLVLALACVGEEPPEKLRVQALGLAPTQLAAADAIWRRLELHALTHQPWLTAELDALLSPWQPVGAAEAASDGAPPAECGICFAQLHPTTHQLPRLACATPSCACVCHAACLARWFATDVGQKHACPFCQQPWGEQPVPPSSNC